MEAPSAKPSFAKATLLLTLGVFVVIAAINWRFYFATPFFEQGDIAVSALQIQRAKQGVEIYGNYSRFNFNHPGPAFWYAYALGERVFRDGLRVVPSPHIAHSLTGLLLQSFFFAAALALFSEALGAPLFLPLALLLAAFHFGLARHAFTSVWPPHVLLMPFLCFFAACASVAAGRGRRLPLVILAGCFLAHGHVAQPLFVVGLFALAYGLMWHGSGPEAGPPWRAFPRAHLLAGAILALFLIPLAVDWARWPDDNLALIFQHLHVHAHEHKRFAASALYFLSFFSYLDRQEFLFAENGRIHVHFLLHYAGVYAAWGAVAAFAAWRGRRWARPGARRFFRATVILWAAAALLCLEWGVLQDGPMYQFNGYFYFALLFVPLLLAAAGLADWLGARPRPWLGAALCAAAAAVAVPAFGLPRLLPEETGLRILAAAQSVLRADPRPAAPKVIVFSHDDWPVVAAAALALARDHLPFQVDPAWGFMFGRYRALPSQLPRPTIDHATVWRFLQRAPAGVGVPFYYGLRVAFSAGHLDPSGGIITFAKAGNLEQFELTGFTTPDRETASTNQPEAVLEIADARAARDVAVDFRAFPFLVPRRIAAQPMELWVNGAQVGRAVLDSNRERDVVLAVPAAVWNRRNPVFLVMRFPAARSPAELGLNDDPRILGWNFRSISFRYADAPAAPAPARRSSNPAR